jgi:hypothetical protein
MSYNAHSQNIVAKIFETVKKNKSIQNIQVVGGSINKIDSLFYNGQSNGDFEFLNNNGTIWMTQNGSSRVYKIDPNGVIKRLDQTFNQGFNYGATNLIYNDTLYSVGGYGFWQTTGSVRYFNTTSAEWDIIRNIENVPIAGGINAICYYDQLNEKLYAIYTPTAPEYVISNGDMKEQVLLQCFDFKEKKWWNEAKKINPKIAVKFSDLSIIQKLGNDLMMNSKLNGKIMLVNLNENKINEIDYKYHTELKQLLSSKPHYISYTLKDTVNILDLNIDTTYKSYIKSNLLNNYNEPFYTNNIITDKIKKSSWLTISVLINIFLVLLILFGLQYKKNKKRFEEEKSEHIVNTAFDNDNRNFKYYIYSLSIIEKDLLLLLFKNHLQKQNTTVTQINKILGTEKKPFKIQNNIRGEVLTTLNNKFMAFALVSNNLIERQRSEYDKRHMEYYINEKYISKISLKLFKD